MTFTKLHLSVFALASAVACAPAIASPISPALDIRVFPSVDQEAVTEGETVLVGDPDTVYREVSDFARWSVMFPNIREVVVTSRNGEDARVTFIHPDGNRDNLHFRNRPGSRVVWFEDTGGSAEVWAEISFLPGRQAGTTRVHSRLYADVHGLTSLFVSDHKLRSLREQRIREDLTNLRAHFAHEATILPVAATGAQ